jgi:transmembrane sensor
MLEDKDLESSSPPDRVQEEASMWLSRLGRGLRPEEAAGLREWLKQAEHRRVILETARLWHGPDIIAVLGELFPAGPEPMKSDITLWDIVRVTATTVLTVGLILLIVTGEQPWNNMRLQWARAQGHTCEAPLKSLVGRGMYSTSVGQQRQLALPDNTDVTLNTHTCLSVAYSPGAREVYLPYGEATDCDGNGMRTKVDCGANAISGPRSFRFSAINRLTKDSWVNGADEPHSLIRLVRLPCSYPLPSAGKS